MGGAVEVLGGGRPTVSHDVDLVALKRVVIAEGKKPMVTHSESGGSQHASISCLDSHLRKRNRAILRFDAYQQANHIWEVGNKFGLAS